MGRWSMRKMIMRISVASSSICSGVGRLSSNRIMRLLEEKTRHQRISASLGQMANMGGGDVLGHVGELVGDVNESDQLVVLGDRGRDLLGEHKAGGVLTLGDDGEPLVQLGPRDLLGEQALFRESKLVS